MGIDIHALNFLRYATRKQPLGGVATIGRQALFVSRGELAKITGVPKQEINFGTYCEQLLMRYLGAASVDSYDYSDYEGATHIVDMGKPMAWEREYDTVIDSGCSEHIYNVPQALENISSLCRSGGQIIHILPANNFCGHGFWQFSPELFFSLYSEDSGHTETEVFLADLRNPNKWFEVKPPKDGKRAEVRSSGPLYVMCKTYKRSELFPKNVQQSDYIYTWDRASYAKQPQRGVIGALKRAIRSRHSLDRIAVSVVNFAKNHFGSLTNPIGLSKRNRHLREFDVTELLTDYK